MEEINIKERFESARAYEVFKSNDDLKNGKKMLPKELVSVLKQEFANLTDNQCYSIIYRARDKDQILKKEDKFYRLLTEEELDKKIGGLKKTKQEIAKLIEKLDVIPAGQFDTSQDFSAFKSILDKLNELKR